MVFLNLPKLFGAFNSIIFLVYSNNPFLKRQNYPKMLCSLETLCTVFAILLQFATVEACRFPGAPAHSIVSFSDEKLSPGTVAMYSCERGFELLGPSRRICDVQGQWMPEGIPFCVLNVAAGKAPMQISTLLSGIPKRAIDGSTSSFFSPETCTLTRPETVPWWYVNLLEPYMVQLVRLDFGKPCCGSNKTATVVIRVGNNRPDLGTNPICNRFTGFLQEGQPLFLPCNPPMPGAFVSVHLESPSPSQLSICEAFVYTDQALPIERCPQFRDQPPGSTATYNGKCYIFYNRQPMKFKEALSFCNSRGGTLVDESNPAHQGFMSWELFRRDGSDSSSHYWMGAVRDQNDRNNWKWLNGDDITVSFWNLPGGNENCARYDGSKGWLWSDTNCLTNLNFICQHQPKACGRPEQPPNSTMIAENFNVGASIEYACDPGHLLVGPTTRTCMDTGFYNEFPPVCKRIQCGYPADIPNGGYQLINASIGYLSQVVYTCEEGYEIIGRAQLTCDIDERWNGPPPRCEAIHCDHPPQILNGKHVLNTNETTFGSIVEYFCLRGFTLLGAKRLACTAKGQWDHPPPLCKPEEVPTVTTPAIPPTRLLSTKLLTRPTRPTYTTVYTTTQRTDKYTSTSEETKPSKRITSRPFPTTNNDISNSGSAHVPQIIVASHPQEKPIIGPNSNIRVDQVPRVNVPSSIDGIRETLGAKVNIGTVIALGAFGGFLFLAAIIITIVILVKRNQSAKHYRHRASPDCNTVASFDSSSSESRNGLNRYYRQAWENLHESAGSKAALKANHSPLRRKDTLDEPIGYRSSHHRMSNEGMRDGSELVVSDVAAYPGRGHHDKKRHHHHHHHHDLRSSARHKDWSGRDRDSRTQHNHSRY